MTDTSGSEEHSLAPTLQTIEHLFWKAEREIYRTWHARHAHHKADHLYNFCITAHAFRDYYFKLGLGTSPTKADKQRLHEEWNQVPVLLAVRDIANSAKHWRLVRPSDARGMLLDTEGAVDVYMSEDEMVLDRVQMPGWFIEVSPDVRYDTWSFLTEVLDYWRGFLHSKDILIRSQPRSIYFGEDQSESLGPVDLPQAME